MLNLELFKTACRNTYTNYEAIAEQKYNNYKNELEKDLEKVTDKELYKTNYIKYMESWLNQSATTASSYIVGPANFPREKMLKRIKIEQKKYNSFREKREKMLKKLKIKENEIDVRKILDAELKELLIKQNFFKDLNKSKSFKTEECKQKAIKKFFMKITNKNTALFNICIQQQKVPSFVLTNLKNKIKSRLAKIN